MMSLWDVVQFVLLVLVLLVLVFFGRTGVALRSTGAAIHPSRSTL